MFLIYSFFLDAASVGQSRAKCSMQLLQELNPDVSGDFVDENIESLLEMNADFFKSFTVVVACDTKEKVLLRLSTILWDLNIPFVFCRTVGFFGTARLQLKEHCIVETHPDNKQIDLRLAEPFDTLRKHLDESELSLKVPWLVVLHKFLTKWKEAHDGRVPSTYKDKCELKQLISLAMTKDEINYEEAIKAVNSCFGGGKPSSELMVIFNDDSCQKLTKEVSLHLFYRGPYLMFFFFRLSFILYVSYIILYFLYHLSEMQTKIKVGSGINIYT